MVNLARKIRCALNLSDYFAGQVVRMSLLVVKFDSLDERAVKFERKSLNLSPCKRPALPVCEVNFNRVPYAVGTLGG